MSDLAIAVHCFLVAHTYTWAHTCICILFFFPFQIPVFPLSASPCCTSPFVVHLQSIKRHLDLIQLTKINPYIILIGTLESVFIFPFSLSRSYFIKVLGIPIPLTGRLIPVLTLLRVAVIGFPVNNSKPLILAGRKSSQLLIRFSLTWQYFLKQSVLLGHKVKFILCHFYLKVMCPVWPSHRSLCHNQWRAVNTSRQKRKVLPLYDRHLP